MRDSILSAVQLSNPKTDFGYASEKLLYAYAVFKGIILPTGMYDDVDEYYTFITSGGKLSAHCSPLEATTEARQKKLTTLMKHVLSHCSIYFPAEDFLFQDITPVSLNNERKCILWIGNKKTPQECFRTKCNTVLTTVATVLENRLANVAYKKRKKEKATNLKATFDVGSVLYTSWGYEQTNVSFYQVVGFTGKSTVLVRRIGERRVESGYMSGTTFPKTDTFSGELLKCRLRSETSINVDGQTGYLYDLAKNSGAYYSYYG